MKIAAISDLHGHLPSLREPVELCIIAGDFLCMGDIEVQKAFMIYKFVPWLINLRAKNIVVVAGNHDLLLEEDGAALTDALEFRSEYFNISYLQDSSTTVNGVNVYGSPWTPPFYDWAFMRDEEHLEKTWAEIPDDTDILVTHGPPEGILDRNLEGLPCGSLTLRRRIEDYLLPHAHVFGHIHEGRGHVQYRKRGLSTDFYNVSYLNRKYEPVGDFVIFNIPTFTSDTIPSDPTDDDEPGVIAGPGNE